MDKVLDGLGEHEEGGGGCGQDDLQAQEAVNLPEEVWSEEDRGGDSITAPGPTAGRGHRPL